MEIQDATNNNRVVWKPKRKIDLLHETEQLLREVRSILNKVTPENFNSLEMKFLSLPINTEERLIKVVDLLYNQAVIFSRRAPNFSEVYAELSLGCSQFEVPVIVNGIEGNVDFISLLFRKTKEVFKKDPENEDQSKILGNIRFIGELFNCGLIEEESMHTIIGQLIRRSNTQTFHLESLCILLATVGKELEQAEGNTMDKYIDHLEKILEDRNLSPRIQFYLRDIIDLRANQWEPSMVVHDLTPRTLNESHVYAARALGKSNICLCNRCIQFNIKL